MAEEEEWIVEFEESPGRWIPITGAVYRDKRRAEERRRQEEEKLGTKTRVVRGTPIWDEWNFFRLASRLGGTTEAIREMKKRGEAGAIVAWSIYKNHIENLIRAACGAGAEGEYAREPAYRAPLYSDLEMAGEEDLIEQIEGLWRKYPNGIPTHVVRDLIDDWNDSLQRRVGRRIPKRPEELTVEDIEESKRISRELYKGITREARRIEKREEEVRKEIEEIEAMKREIERRLEELKKKIG